MRIRNILLAVAFTVVVAQPALAGDGFYAGAGLGLELPNKSTWQSPSFAQDGNYSLKDSGALLLDIGYKFSNGFRFEIEGQDANLGGNHISINQYALTSPLSGHLSKAAVYLNGNYDFPILPGFLGGTIGGGIGSGWTSGHGTAFNHLAVVHGSDNAFAWQLDAGLVHHILPDLDLQLDYRYQGVGSMSLTETGVGPFHLSDAKTQMITANVRFYFLP